MAPSASEPWGRVPVFSRSSPRLARCVLQRFVAGFLVVVAGILGAPSCTTVIGLDGFQNAPIALCTKLTDCYADGAPSNCQGRIDGSLAAATTAGRSGWLSSFSQDTCLEGCAAARRCLDLPPVCGGHRATCDTPEDCCDFSSGKADCVNGVCCSTRGVRCGTTDDCCSNAGQCEAPDSTNSLTTCGAVVCRDAGLGCTLDDQCCSKLCVDSTCATMICGKDGFDCRADTDCCSGHCGADGRCSSACAPLGGVCHGAADCCGGVACYVPKGADSGFCSTCQGAPVGVHCAIDADCCSGLICDRTYFECSKQCTATGGACTNGGECCSGACTQGVCGSGCSQAFCSTNADCCTGKCLNSTCIPECGTKDCSHDVCTEGSALLTTCSAARTACVNVVCGSDPYCCCGAWDTLCISQAGLNPKLCGACP